MIEQPEGWNEYRRLVLDSLTTLSQQMKDMNSKIDNLHTVFVPVAEYAETKRRVDLLWDRDLGARREWEELLERSAILWQERNEGAGARRGYRIVLGAVSAAVAMLTVLTLLRSLGVVINIK